MGMNLTDNEKRDAIKYLEAGKPLPEKYRFLLFKEAQEVELVWNGKTEEVTTIVLPFQTIEQIDEPRSDGKIGMQDSLFDNSGRQITGWTNKLIWGDNKLILSSLKNGPLRKEIEAQGGLKLIYIDPPFDVGADFSMDITIGDGEDEQSFTKKPSVIEEIAYRDTWGKGADSFIAMIYERLKLMHDLLAEKGSIYVHCDYRVSAFMRLVLDEIFGKDNFINEISWKRTTAHGDAKQGARRYDIIHDTIYFYCKNENDYIWNTQYIPFSDEQIKQQYNKEENGRKYRLVTPTASKPGGDTSYEWKGVRPPQGRFWAYARQKMEEFDNQGKLYYSNTGQPYIKYYLDERPGVAAQTMWSDIMLAPTSLERADYPTQKPEALIERIIKASSNEGDLVADFFCGSGTTLAVAEKLGRKWIGSDLGKFGIHTSRKRLIGVQRELKKASKNFRAFEILNVGRYERESFLAVNDDLRAEEKAQQAARKGKEFIKLIITAYKAEPVESFVNIVGKKRDRLVAVGPINTPVSSKLIQDIVAECKAKGITKVDVLGFDYEMGLDFSALGGSAFGGEDLKRSGIDIQFKIIPREVFDKKAVEKGQVKFYDVAFIEAKPLLRKATKGEQATLAIELTDFSVFYNQDDSGEVAEALRPGGVKVVVENGQVVKISKDKATDIVAKEILTKKWSDWIDYWAVDFDFASRKEFIRAPKTHGDNLLAKGQTQDLLEYEEVWTGDYIFDNEWQSFRTKKNRNLELTSAAKEVPPGNYKVAVKVVDIFGNDTTKVIEVKI